MTTATHAKTEKRVNALKSLADTGINLVGRRCGVNVRDGGPTTDKQSETEEVNIYPGLSQSYRWGKLRQYGNRTNALVMEAKDGTLFWFLEQDQDDANLKAFRKFSKSLGSISSMPSQRTYTLHWFI